jgi:ATP-GRASP peptide maturase of grasp-with-spasm system
MSPVSFMFAKTHDMILIISEKNDASTNGVISWLVHLGYEWLRINTDSDIELIDLKYSNTSELQLRLKKNNTQWINFEDIKAVWYRRGGIYPSNFDLQELFKNNMKCRNEIDQKIVTQLAREASIVMDFIYTVLAEKPSIGNYHTGDVNKLTALHTAKKSGLKIPDTLISTDRHEVDKFNNLSDGVVTKSISEALYLRIDSSFYCNYTEQINKEFIATLPSKFYPSLIQTKIDKLYELRIFFLHGVCFTMAIFSQSDSKTEVDFRKYNNEKPNRTVPFVLPIEIKQKISAFMNSMNLDSGSIDMIVTKNKEYVFLEVNPVGQFGMVSGPCNYNLEKEIATCLINISSIALT